jgi:hypothetical protein
MILKIGYDFENWVWFLKLGMILKTSKILKRIGGGGGGGEEEKKKKEKEICCS